MNKDYDVILTKVDHGEVYGVPQWGYEVEYRYNKFYKWSKLKHSYGSCWTPNEIARDLVKAGRLDSSRIAKVEVKDERKADYTGLEAQSC